MELPPTCRSATRHDTLVFSHHFRQLYQTAYTVRKGLFSDHDPLVAHFKVPKLDLTRRILCFPQPMEDDVLQAPVFQHHQRVQMQACAETVDSLLADQNVEQPLTQALQKIGEAFESAYIDAHQSLRQHLGENQVSLMPESLHGWLQPRKFKDVKISDTPARARYGSYEPTQEVSGVRACLWVRQTRRLESFLHLLRKWHGKPDRPSTIVHQLRSEWNAICKAKGFPDGFPSWCLAHQGIGHFYFRRPPAPFVENLTRTVREETDKRAAITRANRKSLFRFRISLDNLEFGGTLSHSLLHEPPPPRLSAISFQNQTDADLLRVRTKGPAQARLPVGFELDPSLPICVNGCETTVTKIHGAIVSFHLNGSIEGKKIRVSQARWEFQPGEMHRLFFEYWAPFWLRDDVEQAESMDSWHDFLQLATSAGFVPQNSACQPVTLAEWRQAILQTKTKTSRGSCALTQPEAAAMGDCTLTALLKVVNRSGQEGFPDWLMLARAALVPKIPEANTVCQMRPITVCSLVYRLWSKVMTRRLLTSLSTQVPRCVAGGLPGRNCLDLCLEMGASSKFSRRLEATSWTLANVSMAYLGHQWLIF